MRPYKCPVCEGRGTVPIGFYETFSQGTTTATVTYDVTCKTCNGTGIVWDTEYDWNPWYIPYPYEQPWYPGLGRWTC